MTRGSARALALRWMLLLPIACESGRGPQPTRTGEPRTGNVAGAHPTFVRGPTGGAPVAGFIAEEARKGAASGYRVLVYVGATWCEPCQRFHQAVLAGQLDALLGGTRLVEFDLDADRDPLERAGYASRLIPLFAVPRADGTASDARMEGSIKGEAAVAENLTPRLRNLLGRAGKL